MKFPPVLGLFLAALLSMRAADEAKMSAEDFSHQAAYSGFVLSPDGKALVYEEDIRGDQRLYIRDLETNKNVVVHLEPSDVEWRHGSEYYWVSNRRVLFRAGASLAAVDRNGKNPMYFLRGVDVLHLFRDEKEGIILASGFDIQVGEGIRHVQFYLPNRPYIQRVNTRIDTAKLREVENPGAVVAWGITAEGKALVALEINGTRYRTLYRITESSSWETLAGLDWNDPEVRPLGFSPDGKTLYISRVMPSGMWGIYSYDIVGRKLGPPMLAQDRFDIIPGQRPAAANDHLYQVALFSPGSRELLGFRFFTEYPRAAWIDPTMDAAQKAIDQALPQKINTIVSTSDDHSRLTLLSWTAKDPGAFYLFDLKAGKLEKLVSRRPWINEAKMADVLPVRYKARDGTLINGYLTVPQGHEAKNLPLVLLPHRNPWQRDTWEFNPTAQFLASRGYAVLQMNYRGSSGYGEPFRKLGQRKFGTDIAFDIIDGAKWAVRQGIADPKKMSVVGFGGYMGYEALAVAAIEPDLFACVIATTPYTDWMKNLDKSVLDPDGFAFLVENVGDPAAQQAELRATSALNLADKIKAPVLLMHSAEDDDYYFNQTKAMAAALKKSGESVVFKTNYSDEKFGYQRHAKFLVDIEEFLLQHMPAAAR